MVNSEHTVSTETVNHVIEVCEGCLTIGTKLFPDECVSLAHAF